MTSNSVANGFSLRRALIDMGVTLESALRAHLQQAQDMYNKGKMRSFTEYRVPYKSDPNRLI